MISTETRRNLSVATQNDIRFKFGEAEFNVILHDAFLEMECPVPVEILDARRNKRFRCMTFC